MVETSRVPAVIDGLVSMARALTVVNGPLWWADADGGPTRVYDGPQINDMSSPHVLYISDEPTERGEPSATSIQDFAQLGAQRRDENITVTCTAGAWTGEASDDLGMKPMRDRVYRIMAGIESMLRPAYIGGDITLGDVPTLWAHVTSDQLYQMQTDRGPVCRLTFSVVARCRLM